MINKRHKTRLTSEKKINRHVNSLKNKMTLEIVPIHKHPEYLIDCCKVINQEWKRSEMARLHSLKQSCDQLPTSLILLKDKAVIGHLKLSIIPSIKTACFVESVVIKESLRGNGYGSILMKEAEIFCKSLGLDTIYLSTKGQELFYSKLGYSECAPVSLYGSFVSKNMDTVVSERATSKSSVLQQENGKIEIKIPPPPPPPLVSPTEILKLNEKTFMKKKL